MPKTEIPPPTGRDKNRLERQPDGDHLTIKPLILSRYNHVQAAGADVDFDAFGGREGFAVYLHQFAVGVVDDGPRALDDLVVHGLVNFAREQAVEDAHAFEFREVADDADLEPAVVHHAAGHSSGDVHPEFYGSAWAGSQCTPSPCSTHRW